MFKIWNEIESLTALDAERGFLCTLCIASFIDSCPGHTSTINNFIDVLLSACIESQKSVVSGVVSLQILFVGEAVQIFQSQSHGHQGLLFSHMGAGTG